MFTGIIKEVGKVEAVTPLDGGRQIAIKCKLAQQVEIDQSISINGVCHTVTAVDDSIFSVQSVKETLRKTTIGELKVGDLVNLEPSLYPQQLLDGHLVQGHIDSTGTIFSITREGADWLFSVDYDPQYKDLIVGRGSIAINGISLTVADLSNENFTVAIIPYTYEHTTFKSLVAGDAVNLEFDILGKYVVRYLENRGR